MRTFTGWLILLLLSIVMWAALIIFIGWDAVFLVLIICFSIIFGIVLGVKMVGD